MLPCWLHYRNKMVKIGMKHLNCCITQSALFYYLVLSISKRLYLLSMYGVSINVGFIIPGANTNKAHLCPALFFDFSNKARRHFLNVG